MIPTPTPSDLFVMFPPSDEGPSHVEDIIQRRRTAREIRKMLRDIAWVLHWTQQIKHELSAEHVTYAPELTPTEGEVVVAELPV
jgi:hypothetical protein